MKFLRLISRFFIFPPRGLDGPLIRHLLRKRRLPPRGRLFCLNRPDSAQRSERCGNKNAPIQVSTPPIRRTVGCGGAVLRLPEYGAG